MSLCPRLNLGLHGNPHLITVLSPRKWIHVRRPIPGWDLFNRGLNDKKSHPDNSPEENRNGLLILNPVQRQASEGDRVNESQKWRFTPPLLFLIVQKVPACAIKPVKRGMIKYWNKGSTHRYLNRAPAPTPNTHFPFRYTSSWCHRLLSDTSRELEVIINNPL